MANMNAISLAETQKHKILMNEKCYKIGTGNFLTMLWRQLPDSPERTMWPPGSEMTLKRRTVF